MQCTSVALSVQSPKRQPIYASYHPQVHMVGSCNSHITSRSIGLQVKVRLKLSDWLIVIVTISSTTMYSFLLFIFSLLGVLSHFCYFIHGEHYEQAPRIARIYFLSILCLYAICVILSVDTPIVLTACTAGAYFLSFCASVAIY